MAALAPRLSGLMAEAEADAQLRFKDVLDEVIGHHGPAVAAQVLLPRSHDCCRLSFPHSYFGSLSHARLVGAREVQRRRVSLRCHEPGDALCAACQPDLSMLLGFPLPLGDRVLLCRRQPCGTR